MENNTTEIAKTNGAITSLREDIDSREWALTIKNTVAKGATDEEFAMFRELCRATKLNPFRKEIWFIKGKPKKDGSAGQCQIMTGVNGFFAIANQHPQFDGCDYEYGPEIKIEVSADNEQADFIIAPEWVEVSVWRKDRSRPQKFKAFWREYAKDLVSYYGYFTVWAKMPSVMLTKCGESMALRKAFPQELNGLLTFEEVSTELHEPGTKEAALEALDKNLASYSAWNPENIRGTHLHLQIKIGAHKGKLLGHKECHLMFLRNHLTKYREKYSEQEQSAFEMRITDLEREYAALQNPPAVEGEVVEGDDYNGRDEAN